MRNYQLDTRELILEAATEIFALKGFKGATIREICAVARQSVGSINYHFRDKEGLYEAVAKRLIETVVLQHEPETEEAERLPPEEKLRVFIKAYLERFGYLFSGQDQGIRGMFMMREVMEPSECFKNLFIKFQSRQTIYLLNIIADLTGRSIDDQAVKLSAISIIGQCFHFIFGRKIYGLFGLNGDKLSDPGHYVDHIKEFSLAGIKAIAGEKK